MKRFTFGLTVTAALHLAPVSALAQEPVYWDVVDRIRTEAFEDSQVMEIASYLADVIGPRFTGSPNMREAQDWTMARLAEFGLSRITKEPWGDETVGWEVQRVSVHMTAPDYQMVIAYPLALTPGTQGPVVANAVIATIQTPGDLERYRGRLNGAVVLATPPMPTSPRFVQDAFRHGEESLRVFETEGTDLLINRYARGQPGQSNFRRQGISAAEVEEFYKSEGVAVVLTASIVVLVAFRLAFLGDRISNQSAHLWTSLHGALPFVQLFVFASVRTGAHQIDVLALLIIAVGLLSHHTVHLTFFLAAVLGGWSVVVWAAPHQTLGFSAGVFLLGTVAIAVVIYGVRLRFNAL